MSKKPSKKATVPETVENTQQELDVATFVGQQIRERRRFVGMTIAELSSATGISVSNLSKIENAQVSPTLQSLGELSSCLGVPISTFFKGFDDEGQLYHIPKGKGMLMARPGKSGGHTYELLANNTGQVHAFQSYLVTLEEQNKQRATFTHNGMEFLYMLAGDMEYRYGTRHLTVHEGDTVIFDGRTPHGPEKIVRSPARFVVVMTNTYDNGH